jgi:hypothetical protein
MEEVQKMNAQPQILLQQQTPLEKIRSAAARMLQVPPSNVFADTFPDDANYDELFDQGYLIVHNFDKGVFGTRLDGFFSDELLNPKSMTGMSDTLETLVCVDFSQSESEPKFEAYFRGQIYDHVKVSALEDRDSEPYYESEDVHRILEGGTA